MEYENNVREYKIINFFKSNFMSNYTCYSGTRMKVEMAFKLEFTFVDERI